MKIKFLIPLTLIILLFSSFVSAERYVNYEFKEGFIDAGNLIPTTNPVTNVGVLGFVCLDPTCSTLGNKIFDYNTGSNDYIQLVYPTVLQSYGYAIYSYKDDYITFEDHSDFYGPDTTPVGPYTNYLTKKLNCQAQINSLIITGNTIIGNPVNIEANVNSPTVKGDTLGAIPTELQSYYQTQIQVDLEIYDSLNNLIYIDTQTPSVDPSSTNNIIFSWTPTQYGDYRTVIKTITPDAKCDSYIEETSETLFTITNQQPVVSDIPDQTIDEGSSFIQINLDDYVTDPDNLDSEITWTYSGNTELIIDITNRIVTITTPNPDWYGSETITFRATDPEGLFDEDIATFIVNSVNDLPTAYAGLDRTIISGILETFDGSASYDIDGTIVSWDWNFGDGDIGSGQIVQHAFPIGIFTVTLTVTDNEGGIGIDTLTVISNGVPTAVISGGPDIYGYVGVPITFNGSLSTDDGTIVSWDWNFGDTNTDSGIIVTHTYTAEADYTVTLTVTDDDSLTDTDVAIAHITILTVNNPPTITSTPITTAVINQLYTYDVDATDPNGDTLNYSLTNKPTDMEIDENTGLITWTPTNLGVYNVVILVDDLNGGSDIQIFNIEVLSEPKIEVSKKHLFSISSISLPTNTYYGGDTINSYIRLKNIGQLKEKNIAVYASILNLGVETIVTQNLKLGPHDIKWLPFKLNLPYNIEEGEYLLRIEVSNSHYTEIKYMPIYININNKYIFNF